MDLYFIKINIKLEYLFKKRIKQLKKYLILLLKPKYFYIYDKNQSTKFLAYSHWDEHKQRMLKCYNKVEFRYIEHPTITGGSYSLEDFRFKINPLVIINLKK